MIISVDFSLFILNVIIILLVLLNLFKSFLQTIFFIKYLSISLKIRKLVITNNELSFYNIILFCKVINFLEYFLIIF